jgi:signal transduction histidine kinase
VTLGLRPANVAALAKVRELARVGVPERLDTGAGKTVGDAGTDRVEALVRAERVRALFDRNPVAQATVLLNSAIVVVVLWGHAAPGRLFAWAGALWLVAACRLALGAAFRRSAPSPGEAGRWARWFTAGAAVNGATWGVVPLLVGDGLPLAHVIFLAFVLGGMAAGAALSNASRQSAFLAFTVPALLPILVLLLSGGDRLRIGMGILLAIFGAAVSAISRSGGRALAEAVRLRFTNAELARGLAALNSELEARVVERTAELDAARSREREAERQLGNAARLATLGTLAAGVAHEINNPLTYLRSNLSYVRGELDRLGADPTLQGALDEALADAGEGVERVRGIVLHLMTLARFEAPEAQPVDLPATLDLCVDMVRREIQPRARLHREYDRIPRVMGDRTRLVQVFLNLLLNASQAVPEGDPARHEVRIATRLEPDGARVVVEVSDTGCGIPEASLERIWDPFFTTKPVDQGIGLGLSICRSLVGELGGRIAVRSREGAGSTFTVWLKAAEPQGNRDDARFAPGEERSPR